MSQEPRRVRHIMHMILGTIILLGTMLWGILAGTDYERFMAFVDFPPILWVTGILVGGLWLSFGPSVAIKAFAALLAPGSAAVPDSCVTYLMVFSRARQLAWAAGLVGMLVGAVLVLHNLGDPSHLGPGMAYGLLTLLYGAVLAEFVFTPLRQVLVNRAVVNRVDLPIPSERV